MSEFCPDCGTTLSNVSSIGFIVVCPGCGQTWATNEGELELATGQDVDQLSLDDLKVAKKRRAAFYRR